MATCNDIETQLQHCLLNTGLPTLNVDIDDPNPVAFIPHTKRTVCYIVCGLLINDQNEVLMMQEAKESCRGKWYLPAGRLETNETLKEGAKREVLEETGLEFEPQTLLSVETQCGTWYRFTFTGKVTGGKLKTLKEQDAESLQAKWYSVESIKEELPLRLKDILYLIEIGQRYHNLDDKGRPPPCMPLITPHQKCLLRLFIVAVCSDREKVLVCSKDFPHLPVVVIYGRKDNLKYAVSRCLQVALNAGQNTPDIKVCGVLSVEHSGDLEAVNDGICLTVLYQMKAEPMTWKDYKWHSIENSDLRIQLRNKMREGSTVPLLMH
ncbi:8-oxo-dGDP phosphatase NUDT18-like [Lingula anatina]|uniref:8-oxo-dGDP phosphatase NUDT18-like n=1 Tax=Lingula anatina TaxID=7574 RepID=A0A1S3IKR4_LINAN|nr:8-oxo-dGDP phosphatase NUDT18-like [Lingula anatina]|eukprot:XP_013398678.1 8-oxo-dGDP phosphatase NUDT18-like [Lingula anatina]